MGRGFLATAAARVGSSCLLVVPQTGTSGSAAAGALVPLSLVHHRDAVQQGLTTRLLPLCRGWPRPPDAGPRASGGSVGSWRAASLVSVGVAAGLF